MIITLKDGNIEADIESVGARINALRVNGVDIVLGFNSVEDYNKSGCYAGATIGRVANRIAKGRFTLNGKEYRLNVNNGENHLHGGNVGFDKKPFTVLEQTDNSVTMEYVSCDREENYPGNLQFKVKFTVENNSLLMEYSAISDKDTLWCPTNHAYLELISVPAIATIVYWVMNLIKYAVKDNEKFKRFIPLVSAALGAVLGVVAFYALPSIIPATNVCVAILIGGASGLTATGTNQIIKQLGKGGDDESKSD